MAQARKTGKHGARPGPGDDRAAAERKAQILKALAHPARVRIFEAVAERELGVGEIAAMLGAKESITSRHLALMRTAGLVAARKDGLNVYYSNKMPCLSAVMPCLDRAVCELADDQGRVAAGLRR
ncbi:MAG TPA: metalloregulator ArsR/SmtB family transcription factor [bacterium]|nr:metalloregulator ArsR/SmtB family transcription factor [bacterium]